MNFLDIILICIIGVFALRGFFRGLVQEVISLISIVLAIYLASSFHQLLTPHLELHIESQATVTALSYTIIFFGTLIVCWLIAKGVRTVLKITLLGWLDRITGAFFGVAEGVLIGLILLMGFQSLAPNSAWYMESKIAPRVQHMMDKVDDLTPDSMKDLFQTSGVTLPSSNDLLDSAQNAVQDTTPEQ
jgi:membrane protein required for colicin V production